MANSADVLNDLLGYPPSSPLPIAYNFLVPNLKGLQKFLASKKSSLQTVDDSGPKESPQDSDAPPTPPPSPQRDGDDEPASITPIDNPNEMLKSSAMRHTMEISLFTAATEAFSKANTNCTIAESLERCKPIVTLAKAENIRVRGYVSVALGCPYEGPNVTPSKVAGMTASLLEMGVDEVSVADTTGMGTAPKTQELLKTLLSTGISSKDIALHLHDTYGQALVNAVVGLEHGVRTFDSSVAGLGGCPYSPGATGNVATEDLVHCLHGFGAKTGVNLEKIAEIGGWISTELGRANDSRAGKALLARMSADS